MSGGRPRGGCQTQEQDPAEAFGSATPREPFLTARARGLEATPSKRRSPGHGPVLPLAEYPPVPAASVPPLLMLLPGNEALQHHRLITAIYESANTGKPVPLYVAAPNQPDQFRGSKPQG